MDHQWLFPTVADAKIIQETMAKAVIIADRFEKPLKHIAGLDVSNNRFDPKKMIYAAGVLLNYPTLSVVETAMFSERQEFPYIPGLLGFREAPALVKAYEQFSIKPDLMMVDGHGISHPRGMGIATHVGVLLDIPTIGVAKSILVGKPEGVLGEEAGSTVPLIWKGRELATLLRTKKRCSPLIISAGHRITLSTAIEIVLSCLRGYRLPETTRHAHLAANACRIQRQA